MGNPFCDGVGAAGGALDDDLDLSVTSFTRDMMTDVSDRLDILWSKSATSFVHSDRSQRVVTRYERYERLIHLEISAKDDLHLIEHLLT